MKGKQKSAKAFVSDLIADKRRGVKGAEADAKLIEHLKAEVTRLRRMKTRKVTIIKKGRAAKHIVRLVIPDSHGNHIDLGARAAILSDAKEICPDEIVGLGDHLDAGGTFSTHQRSYTHEMVDSYAEDVEAANLFFDDMQAAAPNATWDVLEGNHEQHVERWASREFHSYKDAKMVLELIGPEGILRYKQRGFRYIKRSETYDGLSIPGAIRKGRIHYVHGISHSKHADSVHLERFGATVVFGHIHRAISVVSRTVTSTGHGAWSPGTLARLQPLYKHTEPTSWSHGYGLELVNQSTGTFLHINVPILDGVSMLHAVTALGRRTA